ncbi:hypothetical protein Tco_0742818 [Tanacetum coccineum]
MDDPNITMEEYIRLEEEEARRYGRTFNWQTDTFGKVKNYEDKDDHPIDFETEFPAIVFDNTLTIIQSEPTVCPPNENELDLRISLDESDDEDYTTYGILLSDPYIRYMAPLPAADQRHPWLIYQIQEYTYEIRRSYEQRLEMIWSRPVNRVHVLDFEGLTPEMRQDLAVRLRMVYSGEGQQVFVSHAWRRLFGIRAPLVQEFIMEFLSTCRMSDTKIGLDVADTLYAGFRAYWARSDRLIPDKEDIRDYWMEISSDRDFLGHTPSYVLIRDPVRRLCHMMIAYSISGRGQAPEKVTDVDIFYLHGMDRRTANAPHLLAQYLFRHAEGRKSGAGLLEGYFIGRLAMHFGLVSDEGLRGLQVVTRELPLIDLHKLRRLHICTRYNDTWAWAAEEVAPEIPAPAQPPPSPSPALQLHTMSQRIERLEEEVHDLQCDVVGLQGDVMNFTTEQSRVSTWLISYMTQLMDASGQTYYPFDSTPNNTAYPRDWDMAY